jgi:23S rRNA (adenine2503-C2)-methyltransferase
MKPRPPLQSLSYAELSRLLAEEGLASARSDLAARVMRAVHLGGATSFEEIAEVGSAARARLAEIVELPRIALASVHPAADGSARHAFRLGDGAIVESVLIPHHAGSGRFTVCVSSQAGCPLACRFCATGKLGLRRDLEAWEIVAQAIAVGRHAGVRISDVVFMGMGEPLLNEAAVFRAANAITQPHGLQIGARRITISTAGVVPAIHRFIDERRPFRLVFSLGCADPAKRARLMPLQARFGYDELLDAIRRYERFRRGKPVTLEYVAIRNLTMGDDDVAAIARHLTGFRFLLNVIPFNPIGPIEPNSEGDAGEEAFEAPTMSEVRAFTARLRPLGFPIKIRYSGGQSELAGCGQLGRSYGAGDLLPT